MGRKVVELIRLEESDQGTFGVLKIDKEMFCLTLEQDDEENMVNESSIPAQQYICRRVDSDKYGDTFEVTGVPGRSHILFHSGNFVENTKGCILLGSEFGQINGKRAVLSSGRAFYRFMAELEKEDSFHLTIKEEY
ncbi:MAG: DUF5675 family protein [Desulfobacteraceae bacterium]